MPQVFRITPSLSKPWQLESEIEAIYLTFSPLQKLEVGGRNVRVNFTSSAKPLI